MSDIMRRGLVEKDLDRLHETGALNDGQVMRLITEYNCQLVSGFPIHPWLFDRWEDEIAALWERRAARN